MKKILLLAVLLLSGFSVRAVDVITATISVTNAAGTTNGQTIAFTGSATRTFTNVVAIPATQILTNSTPDGSLTNLFNQISLNSVLGLNISYSSSTSMAMRAYPGNSLVVTLSAGWGTVSYSTQALSASTPLTIPNTTVSALMRTNLGSGTVAWLNLTDITNQLAQSQPAMAQLVGLTNNQTITGNKTMTGTNVLGYIATGTNGVLQSTVLVNPGITNATSISGNLLLTTNGTLRDAILITPTTTNLANYGNAIRSPGSGYLSEQFGSNSVASGDFSLSVGNQATSSGDNATAVGYFAEASDIYATAIGASAEASFEHGIALGSGARAVTNQYVMAIGRQAYAGGERAMAIGNATVAHYYRSSALGDSATTTGENQIMLGTTSDWVSIPGSLTVTGSISNAPFLGTNTFPAGSDIAFGRFAIASVANGANAALPVGTNVFVDITGAPTAAWTLAGIDGQPNRNGKHIWLVNRTGYGMTIAHQSGLDPTAANRIICPGAEDVVMSGDGVAELIYNATASRWQLLNAYASAIGVGGDAGSLTNIPHIIAEAYSSSNLTSSVSFSGSGVWTDVTNVLELTSGSMAGWVVTNLSASATNCALVYTNAPTLHLHTATSLSFVPTSGAGAIKTYHFRMKQNATGLYRGEVVDSGAASGGLESTALHTFMVINTGDVLSLEVMNETDTTGIRLQTVNIFSMAMK